MSLRALTLVLVVVLGGCTVLPLEHAKLPLDAGEHPQQYVVVAVRNESDGMANHPGATVRGYDTVGHYGPSAHSRRLIATLQRDYGLRTVAGWPIGPLHLECVVFRIGSGTVSELLPRLMRDPRVRIAEPLQDFRTLSETGDPYRSLQKNLKLLGLDRAHRVARGSGVRIALVDTGVSIDHPDLAGAVVKWRDFTGRGTRAFKSDVHGTEVAGVIAARADNGIGIAGVAPKADLIALKACWQRSGKPHAVCNTFTLAESITYALESHARIVNLSLTGPADPLLFRLVTWGVAHGVIFVGAVAPDGALSGFPADVPGVLAVDRAESANHSDQVLYAPGDGILTLTPGGHYDFASGSSMAAAEVSGLVALLIEHEALDPDTARRLLLNSERKSEGSVVSVNVCAAFDALAPSSCSPAVVANSPVERAGRIHTRY